MVKQNYFVNTSQKVMDVEVSFAGGMVSQIHPEKLNDDQSVLIENADLIQGGVLQARGAYNQTNTPSPTPISGNTQWRGKYQNLAGGQDMVAINGNLYTVSGNTYTKLNIAGLPTGFQTSRPIEAVQYRDKLYFATGSGIVVYDGVNASLLNAYAPNGLEALYIGTNGYAANPDNYLSDMTGAADVILGVVPSTRYGITNQNVTFTAYIEYINGDTLEYKWEIKKVVDADYPTTPAQDWSSSAKQFTTNIAIAGDYMIRVSMRKTGTTAVLSQYVLPRYKVQTTPDENPEQGVSFANLSTCNRILVWYDRLMIYGDTTYPDNLYISHLKNFAYFPRTNIIPIIDPLRGALNKVIGFKNFLVCFTDGSIQKLEGQDPSTYKVSPIHTTLGTKFGNSIQVMKNYLSFVGSDYGIYVLKTFNYASNDKINVERIDDNIRDVVVGLLKTSTKVLSTIYNNQYYLYIENSNGNLLYRYYYEYNVWVRDSTSLSFATLDCYNNVLLASAKTGGTFYSLDNTKFKDGTNTTYSVKIQSKDYDFGYPHHRKKLKQYQILAKITAVTTITVDTYLDNNLLSTTNLIYDPNQNTDAQKLSVMASGRFRYAKINLTIPVNEIFQIVGFAFVYKMNTPK
jgi:hypothetical protein